MFERITDARSGTFGAVWSFYTNITLTGVDSAGVVEWLPSRTKPCFVEVSGKGVIVFDAAGEAQDGSHLELAAELSSVMRCKAVAVLNHDDDVLQVEAFVDGSQVDRYDSCSEYFEEDLAPAGGEHLASLLSADEREVEAALRDDIAFASERHERLAEALHLPTAAVDSALII